MPALLAKWMFRVPLVVHVRSPQRNAPNALRTRWINARLRREADAVIAISVNTRLTLPPDIEVDVIQNSFTPKRSPKPDPQMIARLGALRPGSLKIGFVGNLHHSKGSTTCSRRRKPCARAAGTWSSLSSAAAPARSGGQGLDPGEARAAAGRGGRDARAGGSRAGLADSFHLLGATTDIQCAYERMDVVCFPSHFDAPGRPVFEAAFSAVPSIVAVTNPQPDTLQHGETGLAFPGKNVEKLAEAISYFADNRAEVKRMGENARRLAQAKLRPAAQCPEAARALPASARNTRARQQGCRMNDRNMTHTAPSKRPYQICSNCIMDTSDSNITFDARGWCDYCNNYYENILPNWHPDERGERELAPVIDRIKADGKGKSTTASSV